jgi:hypothetical protein
MLCTNHSLRSISHPAPPGAITTVATVTTYSCTGSKEGHRTSVAATNSCNVSAQLPSRSDCCLLTRTEQCTRQKPCQQDSSHIAAAAATHRALAQRTDTNAALLLAVPGRDHSRRMPRLSQDNMRSLPERPQTKLTLDTITSLDTITAVCRRLSLTRIGVLRAGQSTRPDALSATTLGQPARGLPQGDVEPSTEDQPSQSAE